VISEGCDQRSTSRSHHSACRRRRPEVAADAIGRINAGASVIHSHIGEVVRFMGKPGGRRLYGGLSPVVAERPDAILASDHGRATADPCRQRWEHY